MIQESGGSLTKKKLKLKGLLSFIANTPWSLIGLEERIIGRGNLLSWGMKRCYQMRVMLKDL
ncbi:hypothetical protein VZ94_21045 [Methylocucumis oryzae]|uniref:Uncharacterized protein n=1 Tax=Methylocucumis oryzae TaxID=1632867 RepID=A0A0F3IER2_9GAMM|nr:hypothetical protein VZ94_21045 [Methylocucumis oryzae]